MPYDATQPERCTMTSKAYKARITLSKEHLDIAVRNIVRTVRPRA